MQKSHTIARNSVLYGLDIGIALVAGILCSILVARQMGPAKLGEYNYITWIVYTLGLLSSFGLPSAVRKFASEHYGAGRKDRAEGIIRFTFWLQSLLGILLCVAGIFVARAQLTPYQFNYAWPAIVSMIPMMAMGTVSMANAITEDFRPNTAASIVGNVVNLILTLAALRFGWDLQGLTLAMLASRVADLLVRLAGFHRIFGSLLWKAEGWFRMTGFTAPEKRQYARFCLEATLLLLIQTVVWGRSEMWFLNRYWPKQEVSFYSLGFNYTDKVQLVPMTFAGAVSASLMVEFGRNPGAAGALGVASLRYLALIGLPLLAGLCALSRPLVLALYGAPFLAAAAPLALQCVLLMPRTLLTPGSDLLVAADRQRDLVRWGLFMCAVNLWLDWWWIRGGGAMGAAWANGVAQILATGGTWWLALRFYRIPWPTMPLLRITLSAGLMGVSVWALTIALPPVIALVVGVPVGSLLYPVFLRVTRSLDPGDRNRLLALGRMLPARLRRPYGSLLDWLAA